MTAMIEECNFRRSEAPEISIICSSHLPQLWERLLKSIGDNDTSFEIIFVGPYEPNFKVPNNFKFIKTNVKPIQCMEIAARNATGNLLLNVADDIIFKTQKPLDKLYNAYKSYNDDKIILSCVYYHPSEHLYFKSNPNSPILACVGLMSRNLYVNIGGLDKNFIGVYGDTDISMRIYELGGSVILSKDVYIEEHRIESEGLCGRYPDRPYLDSLWVVNGKAQFNRAKPVEPFSDDRILEESQGPKGKWI